MIDKIIELATEAGIVIREIYESGKFNTSLKKDNSPVTTADEEANELIVGGLNRYFPRIPAISEESEPSIIETKEFFIVDPMDGTKGFLNRTDNFTVNIALVKNRKPELGVIYSPISGELFYTSASHESYKYNFLEKSKKVKLSCALTTRFKYTLITSENNVSGREDKIFTRKLNYNLLKIGSSIKFCRLAEGLADVYPRFGRTMEWDTAAGHAILKFAGGSLIDLNTKKELTYGKKNYENGDFIALRDPTDIEKIKLEKPC